LSRVEPIERLAPVKLVLRHDRIRRSDKDAVLIIDLKRNV
jgi:hypothetical protein